MLDLLIKASEELDQAELNSTKPTFLIEEMVYQFGAPIYTGIYYKDYFKKIYCVFNEKMIIMKVVVDNNSTSFVFNEHPPLNIAVTLANTSQKYIENKIIDEKFINENFELLIDEITGHKILRFTQ